ncbi:LLM class F420-dependent oxidoreductase [Dactylosporangium sp. NBC_01737]|uniref:LLM class F420-dependent oxidoreductase n=1 Tax=Dactylosporangium sp. NBC_01737 TaxID=2975959 RepID=UPI002E138F82|nr:LLM class F420-dependent oxidoreductase [Dactylosporangium sp. NBC_01737]
MDFRVFTEPQLQGATYAQQVTAAQAAEDLGYTGYFRSDHFLAFGPGSDRAGPTDSWLTLAGIARETRTIRLGTLVSAATLRLPGPLAIQVAQVDEMSEGRVELGLGAGSHEDEHTAYGIPFPARRFDPLEEQLEILKGLWSTPAGSTFDFIGKHYRLHDAPALPGIRQRPHPPLIVGGHGARRTPRLAARFADEFNIGMAGIEKTATAFERVRAACAETGRDPRDLTYSVALTICCGGTDAEVTTRAHRLQRGTAELRSTGLAGSPAEIVEKVGRYAEAGVQRCYLQFLDLTDLDHLELVAHQVLSQAR